MSDNHTTPASGNAAQIAAQIAAARETMQHLIETNSPLRELQERRINLLKARLAAEVVEAPTRHAFTVERTNGDHWAWTCRCGTVIVQDPEDLNIHVALIAHANTTGGAA